MKKFLTIVAIATLSLGLGAISLAQDAGPQGGQLQGKHKGGMGGGGLKLMLRFQQDILSSLSLTDAQKKSIQDLNTSTSSQVKDIRKQNKGTTGNKNVGAQVRKVMQGYNNSLQGILTPDEWKSYREQMLAKMKEYRDKKNADKDAEGKDPAGKTPPLF